MLSWKLFTLWFSSCQCFHCSANGFWQWGVVLSNTTKNDNFLNSSSQNYNKNRKSYNPTNWLCNAIVCRVLPFQFSLLLQYQISITTYLEIVTIISKAIWALKKYTEKYPCKIYVENCWTGFFSLWPAMKHYFHYSSKLPFLW